MQSSIALLALFSAAFAAPAPQNAGVTNVVIPDLVPQFGVQQGVGASGVNENCIGINNVVIPCFCPPDRQAFIAQMQVFVSAGNAFGAATPFPQDGSVQSQLARLETSLITLQNFNGTPGVGCPASSTTFLAQQKAISGQ